MLSLSSRIATFGFLENYAATVIGAMIVASLGQPIIAIGGAFALCWKKEYSTFWSSYSLYSNDGFTHPTLFLK
jgi:uncharacterized membrane protein